MMHLHPRCLDRPLGPSFEFRSEMEIDVQQLVIRFRLVQVRRNLKKKKKDFSGWRPAIAFLYLFLFHSLLRLTSFDLVSFIPYFWLKVRNLVAYENHARIQVYVTQPTLFENA